MTTTTITYKLKGSNHVGVLRLPAGKLWTCREVTEAVAAQLRSSTEELDVFISGTSSFLHPDEEIPAYSMIDVVRHVARTKPTQANSASSRGGGPPAHSSSGPPSSTGGTSSLGAGLAVGSGGVDPSRELTEEERLARLGEEVAQDTGMDEARFHFRSRGRGMGGRGAGSNGYFSPGDEELTGRGGRRGGRRGIGDMDGNAVLMSTYGGRGRGIGLGGFEHFRPPPKEYICHNCGKGGHLIQHCPEGRKGAKVLSLPVGIPETMLVECTMDDTAAKFITRDGRLVKRRLDSQAFTGVQTSFNATEPYASTALPASDATGDGTAAVVDGPAATSEGDAEGSKPSPHASSDGAANGSGLGCAIRPEHRFAVTAMLLPCCSAVACEACFTRYVEDAIERDERGEGNGLCCPGCSKPLLVDDVVPAHEARKHISELLASGKRPR